MKVPETTVALLPTESPAVRSSSWVRGPVWDGVWMLNALWLVPLVVWLASGDADAESSPLNVLYFGVTALFWIGHRLCSTWLAYCTEAYRPLLRDEPVRFVVLPLLIITACFAVFLPADEVFPWTREERLVGMAILDYAFVTHHFALQHFGALSLYRTRANRARCARTRRLDRIYALGVGGALVFLADILAGSVAYQGVWMDRWFLAAWLASNQEPIREAAILVLLIVTVFMLVAEVRAPHHSLPRVLYIVGLAAMVVVALRPRSLFLFLVVWTSQHWILATGLASQTARREPAPAGGAVRGFVHALNARPWALVLVFTFFSVLLLPFFEIEANRQDGTYYGDWLFGAFAAGLRTSSWIPALVAVGFATGFVHYLMDRNVYRMSDRRVRSAAWGILEHPGQLSSARRPTGPCEGGVKPPS
ncbi:MAG TPA: hypothetical protein VES20_10015 [Bryobacteraceae bacterium]|nr:hypothetical protein [Bryobacteraceae bacterium]